MNSPTRDLASALRRSTDYLKLLRESYGGFLVHAIHYWIGHSSNAPTTWDIYAAREAIFHAAYRHDVSSKSEPCTHQVMRSLASVA